MGIRFLCPNGHRLNVKAYLAGKRGICPECDAKFLVPGESGVQADSIDEAAASQINKLDAPSQSAAVEPPSMSPTLPPTLSPSAAGTPPQGGVADAPAEQWYVRLESGEQFGPADTEVMRGWVAEGRVAVDSWVWRTGWPEWKPGEQAITLLNGSTPPATLVASSPPPLALPEESASSELPVSANPTAKYLSTKVSRQARARKITFFLSVIVLLLFAILIAVLMNNS